MDTIIGLFFFFFFFLSVISVFGKGSQYVRIVFGEK